MAQHDEFSRNVVSVLSGIYSSSTSLGGGGEYWYFFMNLGQNIRNQHQKARECLIYHKICFKMLFLRSGSDLLWIKMSVAHHPFRIHHHPFQIIIIPSESSSSLTNHHHPFRIHHHPFRIIIIPSESSSSLPNYVCVQKY